MPPLRKKGRGGGGGKTEAPLPGEMPGASPSISSASLARKERERRATPTARATATTTTGTSSSSHHGVENNSLGVFVSRSFQKEKGEKKLLEASRTSLHMTSGSFQRSLRARKAEASSTDSTPRVISTGGSAFSSSSKRDVEREKKSSSQAGSRASSACRGGREEPGVGMCRTSCRELGEEKILHRRSLRTSSTSGGAPSEERHVRRAAGIRSRDERSMDYSTRYNSLYPGISSSAAAAAVGRGGARESSSVDGGSGISQRLDRERGEIDLSHRMKPSPMSSPAVVVVRKSPRAVSAAAAAAEATASIPPSTATSSPVVNLPVKSSCKCGAFRSSDSSPSLMGVLVDDRRRGQSPLANAGTATISARVEGRERKSRELLIPESQVGGATSSLPSSSPSSRTPAGSTPNLLQGRLALLEGRVTQIAAELKATKDLLDDNNPACSKAVLTDIQMKITGIEKAINYRLAKECGLADHLEAEQLKGTYFQANEFSAPVGDGGGPGGSSGRKKKSPVGRGGGSKSSSLNGEIVPHGHGMYGKVSRTVHSSRALTKSSTPPRDRSSLMVASQQQQLSRMGSFIGGPPGSRMLKDYHHQYHHNYHSNLPGASFLPGMDEEGLYSDEFGGSAPSSHVKPVLDHNEFEERLYPHQKLLRSRPSVHQKLIENRVALHQKLVENSVLLRNKLAALEERDGLNCGGALSGEFISSLKHNKHHHQQFVSGSAERGKAVRGGRRGLEEEVEREAVPGDTFPIPNGSHAGFLDYEGEIVAPVSRERRSSRDGRRMSSSRRSFSGLPSDSNSSDLVFLPFEKGSSGTRTERSTRRRSSEKRKSISTSDCYSPELPISTHGVNQIVMLEPSTKQVEPSSSSPHRATLTVDPGQMGTAGAVAAAGPVLDLECTEAVPDRSPSHQEDDNGKELWLADESEKVVDAAEKTTLLPSRLSPDGTGINLECEEILSSGEGTDDLADYQGHPLQEEGGEDGVLDEDEEQAYLGECEDTVPAERIQQIGDKIATAGWFISEGEGILLAHNDASCSFHDASNMECKSKYKSPPNLPSGSWRDCWLIRAAGPDGTLNKYVVAASVSSAADSAFCSWDFYDRRITAFHFKSSPQASPSSFSFKSSSSSSPERVRFPSSRERQKTGGGGGRGFSWYMDSENAHFPKGRTPSGPLSLDLVSGGSGTSDMDNLDVPLRWYRPCSPLMASAGSGLKTVTLYDIRDGAVVMRWDLGRRVASMEFSSPIQWRNKGRLVLAEEQSISVWDVNSMTPQCVNTVSLSGKELQALYVRNSDADFSGGIRQRASSRDQGTGDGILCTQDAVNVLDFRVPAGIVLKIPTFGETAHSVSANGDSVFAGVTVVNGVSGSGSGKAGSVRAKVNEWSVKQGRPMTMYKFPESSAHQAYQAVTQVWGNSETVMGVNGNGLFVFDSLKGALPGRDGGQLREVLGTDDLVQPSFDHAGNRVLLISRDRPASWCCCP